MHVRMPVPSARVCGGWVGGYVLCDVVFRYVWGVKYLALTSQDFDQRCQKCLRPPRDVRTCSRTISPATKTRDFNVGGGGGGGR